MPTIAGSRDYGRFDELAEEFAERFRRGERPSVQEYVDRLPEMADEIRELFPALAEVEQVERDARRDALQPPPTVPRLEQIGDYRILREVGRGGMGVVYEAEQISLGRRVALKVLPGHMVGDRMIQERFRREARAAARLHHTNIVPIHEVGQDGDVRFYAMQFIDGLGLDAVIAELRRLLDRARSHSGIDAAIGGRWGRLRGAHVRPGIDTPTIGAGVEVSAVLRSILAGRFDPGGRGPDPAAGPSSMRAGDRAGPTGTGAESRAAGTDLAPTATDAGGATAGDPAGSQWARLPEPDSSAPGPSSPSSAILPGGTQLSSVESGRHAFFRSLAQIGRQVAGGLAYAHARGILHRDIKPSNLLLDTEGVVWIADFGLAKGDDEGLTLSGDILGTLRYMAPERFRGQGDARADVYALGLTLYELLTLRPAFDSSDRLELIERIKAKEPPRPRSLDARIPRDLETIVLKAIDKDPQRRYATAEATAEDLRRFLADEPIQARRQSQAERYLRWARHHPGIAVLGGLLTAVLMAVTIGSVVVAAYFRDLERQQRGLVQAKATLAERNRRLAEESAAARKTAEDAQVRAETTLVDMQTSRGLLAAERDDPARALLWFSRAAEEGEADSLRKVANRLRARNWARSVVVPVRAFPLVGSVRVLEFRPGGDLLLSVADDRLFVRDLRQDRFIPWGDAIPQVGAACWSPDGQWLAIGYHSGVVQIRGVHDGRVLLAVKHPGAITAMAFSPGGQHLALAATEVQDWQGARTVLPWDLAEQKVPTVVGETAVRILSTSSRTLVPGGWEHPQPVHSLGFNRAGDRLITAGMDKRARVFAVPAAGGPDRPAPLFDPLPHEPRYPGLPALVEDDRRLITLSRYGMNEPTELTAWDAETGKPAGPGIVRARPTYPPRVVAGPRGDWFATAGHYGPEVWRTADRGTNSVYLGDHTGYVQDLVSSPDGRTLLSVSWDQTARLWSVPDGRPLGSPLPHMGRVIRCAIAGDNLHLATVAEDLVRVWRRPDEVVADIHPVDWLGVARPGFDGELIAPGLWHEQPIRSSAIGGGELLVRGAGGGTAAGPAVALRGRLVDSCVCADNRTVAAVSEEQGSGWLSLNDARTGRAVAGPGRLPGSPRSVAARPHSPQVAVLSAGGELLVFDHRTGGRILDLDHDGASALSRTSRVEYTADGSTLVSLADGGDHVIHIRDAATGRPRCPPIRPVLKDGPCRSFALSADSRLLATAVNGENAAQVWDLATGRALSRPLAHPGDYYGLFCLGFSRDGRHLLTGCKDGQARLWDWQAAALACPPLKQDDEVLCVALTADGRFALTAGRDRASNLHVWELATGRPVAPRIPLPNNVVSLSGSPADSRVVASSLGFVARIDLARLLAPPEMPIQDYRLLGELASGQRIERGDESGLTQAQWLDRLDLFNKRHPAYGRPGPADRAMDGLRPSLAAGTIAPASTDRDRDRDPLRGRPDPRALMLDRGFPANPFAGPSLAVAGPARAAPARPLVVYGEIGLTLRSTPEGALIADLAAGGPAARDGRLRPGDTVLGVAQEPDRLFAGRTLTEVHARLGGNAGTTVRVIVRPGGTDRREVYELTRDPIAAGPVQADAEGAFQLGAAGAGLHGNIVRFEAAGGRPSIGWWEDAREWASWDVRFDRPGPYDAWLDLATIHPDAEFIVEIGDRRLTGRATNTGGWERFRACAVGRVEIKSPGVHGIRVRARDAASWKPINLRAIRLAPIGPEHKPE